MNIETVLGCNARCIMCSVGTWERKHGMMDPEIFTTIVDQMADFKDHLKSVALFLDGEPLIDKFLEDRIGECRSKDIPQVGFTTNGSLFNPNRIKSILDAEPDWIVFSIDSLDKETYERIRVRLKFERVQENVHEMIRLRNKLGKRTRIIARLIEQDYNRGQFPEFQKYFSKLLDNTKDEIHCHGIHNWGMGAGVRDFGTTKCGHIDTKFVIYRDGTVPLCCIDFNGGNVMGNVMNNHILEIFNNHIFSRVRDIHNAGQRNTMKVCETCDVPEANSAGALTLKLTPAGKVISNDAFRAFDNEKARSDGAQVAKEAALLESI